MSVAEEHRGGQLTRSVGFYGLMFVSLGSIIGSGWLLGALTAAETAGPASIISWVLAAAMLATLALVYAELGATYPVAGGSGRFPYYSHGPITGFIGGWAAWVQAVFIAPIEVLAAITYVNSVSWVNENFALLNSKGLLNTRGLVVAVILMLLFTAINLAGAEFMSESNVILVIWKTAVPFLAIGVIASLSFHPGNFTAGGGFMPFGWHGVFEALPLGVVFALQGFEQAVCLAGEARNPRKDLSRAILTAMGIGALLYTLLQVTMIAGLNPADIATDWNHPLGQDPSDYGAWYTLALAVGATWLAVILIIDAVISPSGTGIVYLGTSARLSYALGEEREMPGALAKTNARGVPVVSIIVALVVGLIGFGPFKSWAALVSAVTGATAVMYAMAPIALGCAPSERRRPAAQLPDAPPEGDPAHRLHQRQPDPLLGRVRREPQGDRRHRVRPRGVHDRIGGQPHARLLHVQELVVDPGVARWDPPDRLPRPVRGLQHQLVPGLRGRGRGDRVRPRRLLRRPG